MEFTTTIAIAANVSSVMTLRSNEDFLRRAARAMDAELVEVSVQRLDGGAVTVDQRRTMPADVVPPALRAFLPQNVELRVVEAWAEAEPDDDRRFGTFALQAKGIPVSVTGSIALSDSEQGCELTWSGEVTAGVPMFANVVEGAVRDAVVRSMQEEARQVELWDGPLPESDISE
ncbi:DUF2505 domain-containing protein [Jonesia quinghaiensis]|uniref:DUF2505 domain-containing protein n=1 Tax=Jonesia quinghaiensis TaxID=262806 RepID=UPI000422CCCE|nr:DUF2505 domain-containing protein [Jonesia quinghaiensis]